MADPAHLTDLAVLGKMKDLFTDAERWVQHADAIDDRGDYTWSLDPKATCWCLTAASTRACGSYGSPIRVGAIRHIHAAINVLYGGMTAGAPFRQKLDEIAEWNDKPDRTFGEVRDVLDLAYASAYAMT